MDKPLPYIVMESNVFGPLANCSLIVPEVDPGDPEYVADLLAVPHTEYSIVGLPGLIDAVCKFAADACHDPRLASPDPTVRSIQFTKYAGDWPAEPLWAELAAYYAFATQE